MTIKIHPSHLGFVYESCPRCLWLHFRQVSPKRGGFEQFNLLDGVQQHVLKRGTGLHELGIPGTVLSRSDWAISRLYGTGGHDFQIVGKFDLLVQLDAGGVAVVDLKTAKPNPAAQVKYQKQLSAYALALAEPERFEAWDVRGAFLCHWWAKTNDGHYQPDAEPPTIVTYFQGHGVEVPIDISDVREAMETVVAIATEEFVPDAADDCPNCNYVREYGFHVRASRERQRVSQGVAA